MVTAIVCSTEACIPQAWGDMAFSPSVAGFLGQPATQGGCTDFCANLSSEGSPEEMESPRETRALRCLGGQSEKGGKALHQVTGSVCFALPTEAAGRKQATRDRLLSPCVNLLQLPVPLKSSSPDLLSNSSPLSLPSPNVNLSMHPLNFHTVTYHFISSQPATLLLLLQHPNPDSNTGDLNPADICYILLLPSSSGKGPSPTTIHPQSCASYLPISYLSSYYCSLLS